MQTWAKANNIPVSVVTDSEEKLIDPGLQAVRRRAGSIYRHGLVQPVTLIDTGTGTYTVQVGETRVLAHAWLAACGESKFEEIEAKITQRSSKDYTRKYVENVEREDLSGIEKMISVCQVLFELSGQNVPDFNDPKTLIRMKQIRDDGPTKHGLVEWRAVESDLNLHTQLRYYLTQLLDLPFEALAIALAHRVAEGTLRTLMNQTKANEELRLQVLKVVANRAATEGPSVWTSSNMTATIAALQNSLGSSATPAKFLCD